MTRRPLGSRILGAGLVLLALLTSLLTIAPMVSLTHAAPPTPTPVALPIPTHVPFTEYNTSPISAVGKLFTYFPPPEDYIDVCTGTALISQNQSVVDTAAHCFFDDKGKRAEPHNIVFCPQYRQKQEPLGCWRGQQVFVSKSYKPMVPNAANDFALLVVKLQPDKTTVQSKVIGAQPLPQSLSLPVQEPVTLYGYPDDDQTYHGEELFSLTGTIQTNNLFNRILYGSYLRMPGGYMAPGASGGPWFARISNVIYIVGHQSTTIGSTGESPNFKAAGWYDLFAQAQQVQPTA